MYNINNPSNWSWSRAFDEVNRTIRKAELEQQIMNHLDNYSGDPKRTNFPEDHKDDHYTILFEIL